LITTQLSIVGNLTHDPELRRTQNGKAVVNLTIAATPRQKNSQTNQWEDGEPIFQKCTVWDDYAEAIADSLHKGDRVIATGVLKPNSWTDKDSGVKRSEMILQIDEIGVSPRYAYLQSRKRERGGQHADSRPQNDQGIGGQNGWATDSTTVSDDTPF
jgi:single-strand DNA-binding protein